jgi:RimJ/RimL family protein N-acetyltransferase
MWSDPLVTRHIGGRALTREEVWTKLLRAAGHWTLLGFGYWVLEEKATGRFAGEVGLADFQRDIQPPLTSPEMGWALVSHVHGRGFATEAVQAVTRWSDAHLASDRTVCIVDPENGGSLRVADKCGYREVGRSLYKGATVLVLERPVATP